MYIIGEFGMRQYQISDVKEQYGFADYLGTKVITCILMIISSAIYCLYGAIILAYSWEKCLLIILMCLIKLLDAFAEVFVGRFQQMKRLDVAAKTTGFRITIGMLAYCIALILSKNLVLATLICLLCSVVAFFASTIIVASEFGSRSIHFERKKLFGIGKSCFPIFIAIFLLFYIGNVPKYSIDSYMTETMQANFNFIFMPVFVVTMLASFVFNPILVELSICWNDKDIHGFSNRIRKQIVLILSIAVVTIILATIIGIPVLSWLFNSDLSSYRFELVILLCGGGLLALVNFFIISITIIRQQRNLIWGFAAVAVFAKIVSGYFVKGYGIRGASMLYLVDMVILSICFAVVLIVQVRKSRKKVSHEFD
jgi:O-antigen/teichoic acid export membrane protein